MLSCTSNSMIIFGYKIIITGCRSSGSAFVSGAGSLRFKSDAVSPQTVTIMRGRLCAWTFMRRDF